MEHGSFSVTWTPPPALYSQLCRPYNGIWDATVFSHAQDLGFGVLCISLAPLPGFGLGAQRQWSFPATIYFIWPTPLVPHSCSEWGHVLSRRVLPILRGHTKPKVHCSMRCALRQCGILSHHNTAAPPSPHNWIQSGGLPPL